MIENQIPVWGGAGMNEKLRNVRVLKRLTQYDIQMRAGIPQCKISLIERGYLQPKEEEKKRLAKALGVRPEEIWPKNPETRMTSLPVAEGMR